jgi:hypothetical protein
VVHWTTPEAAHGPVGVQEVPAAQVAHTWEAEQKRSAGGPQPAPAGSQFWSVQTGVPVAQLMLAIEAHALVDAQSAPWLHAVQMPALQTWFTPQPVPLATGVVSTHTGDPEREGQAVTPFMQELGGVQASPAVQVIGTHWCVALHTSPAPHVVSVGRKAESTQTGVPEPQAVVPADAQGLVGAHGDASTQALQAPAAEQTSPVPQIEPGGLLVRSVQTAAPVAHS